VSIDLNNITCSYLSQKPFSKSEVSFTAVGLDTLDVYEIMQQFVAKLSASDILQHVSKEDAMEYYGEYMDK